MKVMKEYYKYYLKENVKFALICIAIGIFLYLSTSTIAAGAPPNSPSNPSPSSGDTGVSVSATLTWECTDPDMDDVTYCVRIYREDHEYGFIDCAVVGLTETSYTPFLFYTSTYFWQIAATDENGEVTEGDWWNFTTETYELEDKSNPELYAATFGNGTFSFTGIWDGVQTAYNDVIPAGLFYLFIFGILFGGIWIKQGDVTIPAILGLTISPLLWLYIPLEYQYVCYWLFVVSIGGLLASIFKARQ